MWLSTFRGCPHCYFRHLDLTLGLFAELTSTLRLTPFSTGDFLTVNPACHSMPSMIWLWYVNWDQCNSSVLWTSKTLNKPVSRNFSLFFPYTVENVLKFTENAWETKFFTRSGKTHLSRFIAADNKSARPIHHSQWYKMPRRLNSMTGKNFSRNQPRFCRCSSSTFSPKKWHEHYTTIIEH